MPKTKNLVFAIAGCIATLLLCALFLLACNKESVNIRVGSLNGPTSLDLSEMPQEGYEFSKVNQPDALVSDIAAENVDIALLPANLAVNLYNKTNGGVKVININTKNVLKLISQDASINDVKGKTIYSAGKGTVVEANIQLWLNAMGLSTTDVNLQFKSDANEVVANLLNDANALGVVNEPVASNAVNKYPELKINTNFNGIIKRAYGDNAAPITGVTIVRTKFLEENKSLVDKFLSDHKISVEKCLANNEEARNCEIDSITGYEMKDKLQASGKILFDINPNLFGGKQPDDNFFYINE